MPEPLKLTKADARRALIRHHFAPCETQMEVFDRLRSIQFDPIAPVGCNHDLVLQSRLKGYKIGDWERTAYEEKRIYDGWDKQACLIPFEGWPARRIFWNWFERSKKVLADHPTETATILKDLEARGPMQPKELEFQLRREDLVGTWHGPSLTKNILRALWNTGQVMTAGRNRGQHLYDLTERVVPAKFLNEPMRSEEDSIDEIVLERHRAMGLLRPTASPEVWASKIYYSAVKNAAINRLIERKQLQPVDIEGMKVHATPTFLKNLDQPSITASVRFVAPLDQLVWDRKMTAHVFGFDYIWEIYVPEAKRRWGYYVLPVVFGEDFVARVEFFARKGKLEIRRWHWESEPPNPFWPALETTAKSFLAYCSCTEIEADAEVDSRVVAAFKASAS